MFLNAVFSEPADGEEADDPWICGVDSSLKIGIDSCAAVSVIPEGLVPGKIHRDDQTGTRYRAANGTPIYDLGRQEIFGRLDGDGAVKGLKFRVAQVGRPLLSVADLVEKGKRVTFELDDSGRNISSIVDRRTDESLPIGFRNRTFEISMTVAPPPPGFPGRGCAHP